MNYLLPIIGMFVATYLPRILPLMLFSKYAQDEKFNRFIKYIPTAVFVALIVKDVFFAEDKANFSFRNIYFLPAILVLWISLRYRSIGLSIITGVIGVSLMRLLS
ncbi:MAG: AzlD domain-containing protein [Peptostreptococcaceae bacterium]|nr:AzlD domain-containing protein [Peptostreptococcaceae bacterium]